jgi:hypothetical protein
VKIPLRLAVAFFAAYSFNTALHECAHALMAHFLGLRAALFQFYVNIEYPSGDRRSRILCALAGPLFSLGFGVLSWDLYKRFRARPEALFFLYSAILAASIFLGNLFSTSFVAGDFGTAAAQLNLPPGVRVGMTLAGGVLLGAFLFRMGPELLQWIPPRPSPLSAAAQAIMAPVVVGTTLVILAFLPMPPVFIQDWIVSSFFWVFAAAGAALAQKRGAVGKARALPIQPFDLGAALGALALVRVLARGVDLAP